VKKKILITCPREQATSLADRLEHAGFECILFPTIEIITIPFAVPNLARLDGIFFTSQNAVEIFFNRADPRKVSPHTKFYAANSKTAQALTSRGFAAERLSEKFGLASLASLLTTESVSGKTFCLVKGSLSQSVFPARVRELGGVCEEIVSYETRPPRDSKTDEVKKLFDSADIAAVTFTNSSAVKNFLPLFPNFAPPASLVVAANSQTTAKALHDARLRVDVMPLRSTNKAIADELSRRLS
jgi:uroporphyrinogen III methyltransferase/synthase